jgi:hypothetical protein
MLQESLELQNIYVAIIPLVMYASGFLASFIMKWLNRHVPHIFYITSVILYTVFK